MREHAEKPHSPFLPFDPPQKAQVSSLYRRLIPGISGIKISFLSKLVYKMMLANVQELSIQMTYGRNTAM